MEVGHYLRNWILWGYGELVSKWWLDMEEKHSFVSQEGLGSIALSAQAREMFCREEHKNG